MRQFNCVFGSSFSDVCLNTYGSLDYYVKMLNDNGIEPDQQPYSGQPIMWDETLVTDQTVLKSINKNNIIFATLFGYGVPQQENPITMQYKDVLHATYTATTPGETDITIVALQDNEVIQVEQETKPLVASEYTFTSSTGKIILLGEPLALNETLFVIYKKLVNV